MVRFQDGFHKSYHVRLGLIPDIVALNVKIKVVEAAALLKHGERALGD